MEVEKELGKYDIKAKRILKDKSKLNALLETATEKILNMINDSDKLKAGMAQLKLIIRMLKAYSAGRYRQIPWKTLVSFVGGIVYFITPTDLIPDFVPLVGMLDDITVVLWLVRSFSESVKDFELWEESQMSTH